MKISLSNYMPAPSEVNTQDVLDARNRLVTYLADWYPELDTRPNAPFGDLYITPGAIVMSALEVALERVLSDLNLNNVSQGLIYNPEFVAAFLQNFGAFTSGGIQATGLIKLKFSENKSYVIDADSDFTFAGVTFKINPSEGNPVTIYPVDSPVGARVLNKERDGEFVVYLPVTGSPGSAVSDGTIGVTSLTYTELLEIRAVGDFDSGRAADSLPELARKAKFGFASANLTSRSGAISFITTYFPQVNGASVVLTGDREMIRDHINPLGVAEGAVDVYVKSRPTYAAGEKVVTLVYDPSIGNWVGRLDLPVVPAFFALKSGIFQVNNFNNSRGVSTVYAGSRHAQIDHVGIAYSQFELLGVSITDVTPSNIQEGSIDTVQKLAGGEATLEVSGSFAGYKLSSRTSRNVTLRFDSVGTTPDGLTSVKASVRDNLSNESTSIQFVGNLITSPTFGMVYRDQSYVEFFNGLELKIKPANGVFDPSALVGNTYQFGFRGKTANFSVNYLYDPVVPQLDTLVNDTRYKPAGVSIIAKSCPICHVELFTINYRVRQGGDVDLVTASQEIYDYINSLVYPDIYEESRIGEIMIRNGASGMQSITQRATFYPSLASVYINKDGTESAIERTATGTLLPAINDFGYGPRNIAYLLDQETIHFNAIVI